MARQRRDPKVKASGEVEEEVQLPDTPEAHFKRAYQDICDQFEAGVPIPRIQNMYPSFSIEDIMAVLSTEYDIKNTETDLLDGMLLRGYQKDRQAFNKIAETATDEKIALAARVAGMGANDRMVKLRETLFPARFAKPNSPFTAPPGELTGSTIEEEHIYRFQKSTNNMTLEQRFKQLRALEEMPPGSIIDVNSVEGEVLSLNEGENPDG